MIKYKSDYFGLPNLLVLNGSAVFRAFLPALVSTGFLLWYHYLWGDTISGNQSAQSPYVITVFVSMFSFMLTFRLNYSYQRYWEATTQLHHMNSKWLDSAICLASFHYQCQQYDDVRPLTVGKNPKVRNETRERERFNRQTLEETEVYITQVSTTTNKKNKGIFRTFLRWKHNRGKSSASNDPRSSPLRRHYSEPNMKSFKPNAKVQKQKIFAHHSTGLHHTVMSRDETPLSSIGGDNNDENDNDNKDAKSKEWRATFAGQKIKAQRFLSLTGLADEIPSLFLQEAAHLYSLLSAVAMSTFRHDIEGTQSPLAEYFPGTPFPPVNPDELTSDIRKEYHESSKLWTSIYFILGTNRSPKQRTLYNAARPFRVIGGISDHEAKALQHARGPYAQMALCNMWLKEFCSREYLNGSTGNVAPPIVGRVFQFISDGVTSYNQCRKVAFVPFPFPHSQLTVLFTIVSLFIFPFLYVAYVPNHLAFACLMNFTTVLCFQGIHEVSRELSNPYITVPNDLPLNNFQAQFNEALTTMYAGFHPDSWRRDENAFNSENDSAKLPGLEEIKEKPETGCHVS